MHRPRRTRAAPILNAAPHTKDATAALAALRKAFENRDARAFAPLLVRVRNTGDVATIKAGEEMGHELIRWFDYFVGRFGDTRKRAWHRVWYERLRKGNNFLEFEARRSAAIARLRKEYGLGPAKQQGRDTPKFTPGGQFLGWYKRGQTRGSPALGTRLERMFRTASEEWYAAFGRLKFQLQKGEAGRASGRKRQGLRKLILNVRRDLRTAGASRQPLTQRISQTLSRKYGVDCTLRHIQSVLAEDNKKRREQLASI